MSLMTSLDLRHKAVGGAKPSLIKVASAGEGPFMPRPDHYLFIRYRNIILLLLDITIYYSMILTQAETQQAGGEVVLYRGSVMRVGTRPPCRTYRYSDHSQHSRTT